MKKIIALLLALVMVLGLAACGASEPAPTDPPKVDTPANTPADTPDNAETTNVFEQFFTKPTEEVSLEVWYAVSGVTAEKFEALVNEYAAANPNVKIELSYAGSYADAASKISANQLTGTAPDLALISGAPMYTGSRGDWAIEELIEDPAFDKDGIYEGVWKYAQWQGRNCALPYGISVPVLYYNKDIVAKIAPDIETNPPKTWDELYALAEKAVKEGHAVNGFDVNDVPWLFKSMLAQNGNSIIEVDGADVTPIYNNEQAVEVGTFWQKLTDNGLMPVDQHANADKTFQAGQTAFLVSSSVRLARWAGNTEIADFGCLPLPSFAQESAALGGNHLVVLPKEIDVEKMNDGDKAKLAAAWDLAKYLMSEEKHTEFAIATGYLPIYANAMEGDFVKNAIAEDGRRQTVYNYLENAWAYTHFDDMGTMDTWLKTTVSEIENGTDVQTALDDGVQGLLDDM